jgi:hypothetical protein
MDESQESREERLRRLAESKGFTLEKIEENSPIVRGAVLRRIVVIVAGLLVGPGGVSLFD